MCIGRIRRIIPLLGETKDLRSLLLSGKGVQSLEQEPDAALMM